MFILKLNQNNIGIDVENKNSDFKALSIRPNPNNGKFNVFFKSNRNERHSYILNIYSSLGLLVYSEKLSVIKSINKPIDLKFLTNGIYFIMLKSDKEVIKTKVIIY